MSDVAAAQAEIERWLVRYQQAPESKAYAPLADAYRAAGRQQDAVRVLESGLQRHPDYVSGLVLLGLCWRELHEDDRAEAVFARVLELDPENLVALRHRAECARRRGVLERAAEYLRRALAIDPFDRDVQADLGLVTTALERQSRERVDPAPGVPRATGPRVVTALPGTGAVMPYPVSPPSGAGAPPAGPAVDPFALPPAPAAAFLPPPSRPAAPPAAVVPEAVPSAAAPAAPAMPAAPAAPPPASVEPPWGAPAEPSPPVTAMRGRAAVEPPPIDLRRVGRVPVPEPEDPAPGPAPAAPEAPPVPAAPEIRPSWRYTRDADRIVVAPSDTPVRGPIRSVEDRLFAAQRQPGVPAPPAAVPAPPAGSALPPPAAAPPPGEAVSGAPTGEFATMTLARIYESQGYLQKAAAIYETLQRQRPDDPEIAQRLMALRRRQAGSPEAVAPGAPVGPAAPAPAPLPPTPAGATPPPRLPVPPGPPGLAAPLPPPEEDRGVAWRLLDAGSLGDPAETAHKLRSVTQAVREQDQSRHHTVIGTPPPLTPGPPAGSGAPPLTPPEDLSRGHEDYQRFLSYLRSLRP